MINQHMTAAKHTQSSGRNRKSNSNQRIKAEESKFNTKGLPSKLFLS